MTAVSDQNLVLRRLGAPGIAVLERHISYVIGRDFDLFGARKEARDTITFPRGPYAVVSIRDARLRHDFYVPKDGISQYLAANGYPYWNADMVYAPKAPPPAPSENLSPFTLLRIDAESLLYRLKQADKAQRPPDIYEMMDVRSLLQRLIDMNTANADKEPGQ